MIAPGTDVLAPAYTGEASLSALRRTFAGASPPLLFLPEALLPHAAAALVETAERAPRRRQTIADCGRYAEADLPPSPFLEILGEWATALVDARLRIERAVLRELGPGDYSLMQDDARGRGEGARIELMADLSAQAAGGGEVTYTDEHGALLTVPRQPGALLVVERGPGLLRRERYLSLRFPGVLVRRLYVTLAGDSPWGPPLVR